MKNRKSGEILQVRVISFYNKVIYDEKIDLNSKKNVDRLLKTLRFKFGINLRYSEEEGKWFK